ncbi:MAG: hypothetical protein IT460_05865 [Planctomycetes bacterium]|nr:hypothetical protein [Planctomycetota bacterium]
MGLFSGMLGGSSLDAILARARRSLAQDDFEEALSAVQKGFLRYPESGVLKDMVLAIRRAQTRAGMSELRDRVQHDQDPEAYERLIALYRGAGMVAEMIRTTETYAEVHANREQPHLLRGEQLLEAFLGDVRARDGREAIDHLVKAASLKPDSVTPRKLLAELYYAIGADRALLGQAAAIERLAGDDEILRPMLDAMREGATPRAGESVDALLARAEVDGALVRDPFTWSGRKRKGAGSPEEEGRVQAGLERLVRVGDAQEAVAIDRTGEVVGEAGEPCATVDGGAADGHEAGAVRGSALAGVARSVARSVKAQVRELDLGAFRSCIVEGPFGVMVVADATSGVVAARGPRGTDPHRLTERLTVAVDGVRGRRAS